MSGWREIVMEILRFLFGDFLPDWMERRREERELEREYRKKEAALRAARDKRAGEALGRDAGAWLAATRRMRDRKTGR